MLSRCLVEGASVRVVFHLPRLYDTTCEGLKVRLCTPPQQIYMRC